MIITNKDGIYPVLKKDKYVFNKVRRITFSVWVNHDFLKYPDAVLQRTLKITIV